MENFTDLVAWKEAHKLVLNIYQVTKQFPLHEQYGLVSQMRRCAVSVTSNITEGFTQFSIRQKIRYYFIANGSLSELTSQLYIAKDVGYLKLGQANDMLQQVIYVHKLLHGLIRSIQKR